MCRVVNLKFLDFIFRVCDFIFFGGGWGWGNKYFLNWNFEFNVEMSFSGDSHNVG